VTTHANEDQRVYQVKWIVLADFDKLGRLVTGTDRCLFLTVDQEVGGSSPPSRTKEISSLETSLCAAVLPQAGAKRLLVVRVPLLRERNVISPCGDVPRSSLVLGLVLCVKHEMVFLQIIPHIGFASAELPLTLVAHRIGYVMENVLGVKAPAGDAATNDHPKVRRISLPSQIDRQPRPPLIVQPEQQHGPSRSPPPRSPSMTERLHLLAADQTYGPALQIRVALDQRWWRRFAFVTLDDPRAMAQGDVALWRFHTAALYAGPARSRCASRAGTLVFGPSSMTILHSRDSCSMAAFWQATSGGGRGLRPAPLRGGRVYSWRGPLNWLDQMGHDKRCHDPTMSLSNQSETATAVTSRVLTK
jgi:hypothetical protein